MSKKTEQQRFTKIASKLLLGVRDLASWGVDTGTTTIEELKASVIQHDPKMRRQAALKLIESGLSQRAAAKVLGVNHKTIQNDVANKSPKNGDKVATGSAATKAHRAATTARAASGGVTPAPSEKYRIIYADPPWDYGAHAQPDYQSEQRDHYATMDLDAICAEPVKDWVEDDAVLFLWVTSPILEKSFSVIHAWGFEYKTSFIWDKIKHNMGHYNSVRHELLLVCTRGACQPDTKQLFDSVQGIERGKHSAKPVEFYDIIETLYTRGRRLEMYSRNKRDGWDVYGHVAELEAAQ
jgi:N6-adenosine-specific RNA methylase IME4